ncbi:MAG TPA: transporter substrate-binding domain-containing protein, partial [Bradyrhizobium sp.]|nr:transporter substrate-binding domain-containing protein [Bradyrhizobium sp.]
EKEQRNPQLGRVLQRRAIAYGIFLRLAFRPVVPANAGTHTARILVSALEQTPFSFFEARGDGSLRSQGRLVETLGIGKFHMQSPCPLAGLITMIRSKLIRSHMRPGKRTSCLARSALLACIGLTAVGGLSADTGTLKELLAPTGSLRVGVYPGSPTSMVVDPASNQSHGLTYDLGQEFAKRLKVSAEYVTFQRVADVISAMKNGEVDFTVANATPARANDVSFSPTLISVELGYLVPANSSITRAEERRTE